MRLSLKHQLISITQQLAYKAFGFNIAVNSQQVPLIIKKNEQKSILYKIPIPLIIYDQYRKDHFIYSDPGITPKQIAEDILVHFKEQSHIQMSSDQFGNILASVKEKYFQDKYQKIINESKISCLDCQQLIFHRNHSIRQYGILPNSQILNLLILFRQNRTTLTLAQLRQKYIFKSIFKIQQQIFNSNWKVLEIFDDNKQSMDLFAQIKHKKQLNFRIACLRHQLIKKQTEFEKNLLRQLNQSQKYKLNFMKFGTVIPQKHQLAHDQSSLNEGQKLNLKKMLFDEPDQRPINLKSIAPLNKRFNLRIQNKEIQLPLNINELFLRTEQCLLGKNINQIYHLYLMLESITNSFSRSSTKTGLNTNKNKYLNTALITKSHLYKILF